MPKRIRLSAFGIHTGGGLVLLNALLPRLLPHLSEAALDVRMPSDAVVDPSVPVHRIPKSFRARLQAVNALARSCGPDEVLLCFNSLPPTVRCRGRVIVYVHAPHFVGLHSGIPYDAVARIRFLIERRWFRAGQKHVDEFWVQTPSMYKGLVGAFPGAKVLIRPFVDDELARSLRDLPPRQGRSVPDDAEYFYPADGVGHKNHVTLLQAWAQLHERHGDTCPRLLLTLTPDAMTRALAALGSSVGGAVRNLGPQSRAAVLERLKTATGLIFPSKAETFGLPLLEAVAAGLPILASELDFSRDVCNPTETFDPCSPTSIARAVERHLGIEPVRRVYRSAEEIVGEMVN